MPHAGPPPLHQPIRPVVVVRAYRDAPVFAAGARRAVRLRAAAGQRIAAPCTGGVRFAGRVAGGPPVITVGCGAWGLRVTVGGITTALARGMPVRAGAALGRATGRELGLSVRRDGVGYVDPVPLLARANAPRAPAPPGAAPGRRAPDRWRPAPEVRGLRTIEPAPARATAHTAAEPDRWLGLTGAALGAAALLVGACRAVVARRTRPRPTAVHRAALRR